MATIPETHADLVAGGVVTYATNGPDGRPQLTAVNARIEDDGKIHTSINTVRQKYRNLVASPHATVFAIDPANPFRTLEVRGDVELLADPGKAWAKAFLGGAVDLDVIDPPEAERIHVVLTPRRVNVITPGDF